MVIRDRPDAAQLVLRIVLVLLISLFLVHWIVLARYAVDLPYMDDWIGYDVGRCGIVQRSSRLFAAGNDTLMPVGRFLDAVNVRLFAGDNVISQILSFGAVVGSLLLLQYALLKRFAPSTIALALAVTRSRLAVAAGDLLGGANRGLLSGAPSRRASLWTLDCRYQPGFSRHEDCTYRRGRGARRSVLCLRSLRGANCRRRGRLFLVASWLRSASGLSRSDVRVWPRSVAQSACSALGPACGPARPHPSRRRAVGQSLRAAVLGIHRRHRRASHWFQQNRERMGVCREPSRDAGLGRAPSCLVVGCGKSIGPSRR